MTRVLLIAMGLAAVTAPALAQTAEQLNAAEYQKITAGGPPAKSMPPPMAANPHGCPPGTYWLEAGYVRHAKWRPAHCATK
ncbi:MAG TPA: hypothetical protein VMI30_05665 [Stellaceae bacterium]|nr:hypothetical protein [Stellaceae bacterium]